MKITEDVRKYAAEEETPKRGMENKSKEFAGMGSKVYTKA